MPFFSWGDKYQSPSESQAFHIFQKVSQAGAPWLAALGWQDSGASGCAQRNEAPTEHPWWNTEAVWISTLDIGWAGTLVIAAVGQSNNAKSLYGSNLKLLFQMWCKDMGS